MDWVATHPKTWLFTLGEYSNENRGHLIMELMRFNRLKKSSEIIRLKSKRVIGT
jgi:hypothetical protein